MTSPASSPLAEPEELAARVGLQPSDPVVIQAVGSASAQFRAAVRQPISLVTDDEVLLDGDGSRSVLLPAAPVVTVAEVLVEGEPVEYQWSRAGIVRRPEGFPDRLGAIRITFDHGYDPIPDEIADVVLERAEIIVGQQAPGISQMSVGGESVTYARGGVTTAWSTVVEAYRLNRGDRS